MVRTTQFEKTPLHETWHRFFRGGCFYCGYHCDDCPVDVATCKCKPGVTKEELADMRLKQENLGIEDSWSQVRRSL